MSKSMPNTERVSSAIFFWLTLSFSGQVLALETIPYKKQAAIPEAYPLQVIVGFLIVLLVLVGVIFLLQKFKHKLPNLKDTADLEVKASRRLSRKLVLHLVVVKNKTILIAEHEHGVQMHCDFTQQHEYANNEPELP